jgi:hypothetical protein
LATARRPARRLANLRPKMKSNSMAETWQMVEADREEKVSPRLDRGSSC